MFLVQIIKFLLIYQHWLLRLTIDIITNIKIMLKLKTTTQFQVPTQRGVVTTTVRLIVNSIKMETNNVYVEGYYYAFDANGAMIHKSDFGGNSMKQWEDIELAENNILPDLSSVKNLKANAVQRLEELLKAQITAEYPDNYGTTGNDWVIDNDVI